ncbi:DUF2239 family protein [Methylobacterium durans]|uniref:DUF2239 domain-containing protein n=1 Tax=Methylobacterium durans TaxID=2202825 RepID=A0A2U8W9J6_9HYPH|nr:DUF2239 family protein [Methylobacterium durans]AWN42814.1 DUF2239 domain-containing protein [Methylobacterium durans]
MSKNAGPPIRQNTRRCVAFAGTARIATGTLSEAAGAARQRLDQDPSTTILVFDRETAEVIDLDLRGSVQDVVTRYAAAQAPARETGTPKRGRPKLGVVPREVTLLPRHWDWLARQPGGASITLRKLVEAAQRSSATAAKARSEAAYRFMSAMAGDLPDFEEAARALFANDLERLETFAWQWPRDIVDEVVMYARRATSS